MSTNATGSKSPAASFSAPGTLEPGASGETNAEDLGGSIGAPVPPAKLTAAKLRQAMARDFGSTVCAWRTVFDGPARGFASFTQFCRGVTACTMFGNVNQLWADLVGEREGVRFEDIDPVAKGLLVECRRKLLDAHGTLHEAWEEAIDPGVGYCDKEDFVEALQTAGIGRNPEQRKQLFTLLRARMGQRSLTSEDLRPLMIGVPRKEHEGMFGAPPPPPEATPLEYANMATEAFHGQDHIVRTLDGFKHTLLHKFGSYMSAWRQHLDLDRNGIVSQKDFSEGVRKLGLRKVKQLWAQIDAQKRGQITLRDLDAETADAFAELEQLLLNQHGSTRTAWKQVFDPERKMRCEKQHFVRQCQAIGYSGDAERLYKLLVPYQGAIFLAYDDLWDDLNKNNFETPHHDYKSPVRTLKPSTLSMTH